MPKRCSCPKYLAREVREKLDSNIYCRPDIATARAVLSSCSTCLPSPCSMSLTPDLGTGLTEAAAIKAPRLRGTSSTVHPPELDPVRLCLGQRHPVSSREPLDAVTLWLDADVSLSLQRIPVAISPASTKGCA